MNAKVDAQTAIGTIVVKIEGEPDLRVDNSTFDLAGGTINVTASEGRGGNMEPKQSFSLGVPAVSGHYDFRALSNTQLVKYSDMYYFKYVPNYGGGAVVIRNIPGADGVFSLEMRLVEASGPGGIIVPDFIKINVVFAFDE